MTIQRRNAGAWGAVQATHVHHAGTWKQPTSCWVNVAGVWKQVSLGGFVALHSGYCPFYNYGNGSISYGGTNYTIGPYAFGGLLSINPDYSTFGLAGDTTSLRPKKIRFGGANGVVALLGEPQYSPGDKIFSPQTNYPVFPDYQALHTFLTAGRPTEFTLQVEIGN